MSSSTSKHNGENIDLEKASFIKFAERKTTNGDKKEKKLLDNEDICVKITKTSAKLADEKAKSKRVYNDKTCFYCNKIDINLIKCSLEQCSKFYHKNCLAKLPTSKSDLNMCPLHICLTCYNSNPKNPQGFRGSMLQCRDCPTAFHDKDECNILGAVFMKPGVFSCAGHFSPECQRGYPSIIHLPFCIECHCNDNLKFCRTCPAAIHQACYKAKKIIGEDFSCERCEMRKTFHCGDVVWAKVYTFRWWPARIVPSVSDQAKKIQHFDGELLIQFFGTDEYYWLQNGRIYPFTFRKDCIEDKNINLHFKKTFSDSIFENAVYLALAEMLGKVIKPSIESTYHKKPPPYKHIKSNRPIGSVQIYTSHDLSDYTSCECSVKDACSYDSMCLNRSMCTECHVDVCGAEEHCQNQKFQKREYAMVKPFWTENRGWALQCLEDIKKDHFVVEYCGDLIDEEEYEHRIKEKQAVGDTNFYFCTLDSTRIIDAGPKGNFSRFMNHSCNPNCETQKWLVNGDARVGIFAKHDIPNGSELTFDYQMDFSHYEKLKCNCGANQCSGLIGKKPQNAILQVFDKDMEHLNLKPGVFNGSSTKSTNSSLKTKKSCINKKQDKILCFKCKTGGKQIKCSHEGCGKFFHTRCLRPCFGVKDIVPLKWKCPCHFCKKCKKSSEYQCLMCPNSYCKNHARPCTSAKFLCPKHSPK